MELYYGNTKGRDEVPLKMQNSLEKKSEGEVVPLWFPSLTDRQCCRHMNDLASPVTCMRQWLSSFRKSGISEWKEPVGRLNGPRSEGGALVEARVFLTLASFSQGCHCTCLTGDTCKMER